MSDRLRNLSVLALIALVYFVAYPDDLQTITAPITILLGLSTALSPWFYGVMAVGMIAMAMVKTWGRRPGPHRLL